MRPLAAMYKAIIICILLLAYINSGRAQHAIGIPLITNYPKNLFQGGVRTWDIKQDSKGIMYFANDEGLVTFNGNFWGLYPLPNKTILRSVYIDKNDRVYVGGQDEFGYFEPGPNSQLRYSSLKKVIPAQYRNFADIWNTVVFDGSVFFRALDRLFRLANNRIEVYLPAKEWLYVGGNEKRLFAQERSSGILEYKKNQWVPLRNGKILEGRQVVSIFQTEDGRYAITTDNDMSFLVLNDSVCATKYAALKNTYTPSFSKINDSSFATATSTDGCVVRDLNHRLIQRVSIAEGLQNNNVTTVFTDRDKNIWAAVDNAVACINYSYSLKYLCPDTVNSVVGYSTLIFKDNLYVSSSNGVYAAPLAGAAGDLSLMTGKFSLLKNTNNGEAWRLEEVNQEILLARNSGIFRIQDKEVFPLSVGTGAWIFLPTSLVYPAQNVIVGTYRGLDLLRYTSGGFTAAGQLKGLSDSYRFLAIDENGDIWASHPYRGVYKIKWSPDSMSYATRLFTNKDGLPASINNYVFKIKNRVLFSTEDGIYEFNPATDRFIPSEFLSVFKGIPVRYMREDTDGNIWFCSERKVGVARFSPANRMKDPYSIHYFPELEGYISSKFDNIYPYDRKNIFIGSEKGLIDINYEKYTSQKVRPTVLLNQIRVVEKKDTILLGGFFPKNKHEGYLQTTAEIPSLPSSFNSFRISYGSPVYGHAFNLEYSFRLKGYDEAWSAWTTKTEKEFTNLPGGHYTFEVKAQDNFFNESDIAAYSFDISPPWYKTAWAIACYLIAFCILLYLLNRWHTKRLLLLQRKFEERQKQLEYIHQLELEKNEKEIVELQNEKLANEVALKKKELASTSMQLEGNQNALIKLKDEVIKLNGSPSSKNDMAKILTLLKDIENNNAGWPQFAAHFDEVNNDLLKKLKKKCPKLSPGDLKVCAYLHLNFSSKQISQLSNITVRSVEIHRYRIRRKMGLKTGQSINDYFENV